jgi:PKD repeat protein
MNNINKLVIISIILFFNMQLVLFSQPTLPDPIVGTSPPYTVVSSAYGPRNTNGTIFHLGIDYPLGKGGRANAIKSDDIILFSMDNSLGYVIVGNWKYQHILVGEYTDNGITYHNWELVADGVENYIFIRTGSGIVASNYTTIHAYSNTANSNTIVTDPWTKTKITIEKYVSQGDQIFASNNNHLDLRRSPSNDQNPFSDVLHQDATTNNITIIPSFKKFTIANNATDFTTGPITSSIYGNAIIVQAEVNATVDKDLDNLQILYSIDNGVTYNDLHSYYYTGTNHNVHEADVIQPNSTIPIADYQKYTTGGIYPQYDVFGHLFFKYIWNSLEFKTGSTNPYNGKYPDGNYKIKMLAHDVTNHVATNITDKIIDNYRPYIRKIEIYKSTFGGVKIYSGEWIWDETVKKLVFSSQNTNTITDKDDIYVRAFASEPMENVNITAFGSTLNYSKVITSTDGLEWEHTYSASSSNIGNQNITINSATSTDLVGNRLEGFTSTASFSNFPKHNVSGTWSGAFQMDDVVHQINIGSGFNIPKNVRATDNLPSKVAISWNTVAGTTPYYKVFRQEVHSVWISGASSGTEISGWISGTSYNDITATEETEYYYYVQSSPNSSGTTPSDYSSKDIGKAISPSSACFGYEQTTYSNQYYTINFTDLSIVEGDLVKWTWAFGDGSVDDDQNPTHVYTETGTYSVTLTTVDANNIASEYEENIYVTDQLMGVLTVDCTASATSCREGDKITLTGSVLNGGTAPYNFRFSLGNGITKSYSNVQTLSQICDDFSYSTAKNYQVVLTVTDKNNLEGFYRFNIYVTSNPEFVNVTVNTNPSPLYTSTPFTIEASAPNGDRPIRWIFWMNKFPDDLNDYDYNSYQTGAKCDITSYDINRKFISPQFSGLFEGTYKAHLFFFDAANKQKTITFSIVVAERKDPCVSVHIFGTECAHQTEFPLGGSILLFDNCSIDAMPITDYLYKSNPDFYNCNRNLLNGNNYAEPLYRGIQKIIWLYDDIVQKEHTFNSIEDLTNVKDRITNPLYYQQLNYSQCFPLTKVGIHTIKLKAYGGIMDMVDKFTYFKHPLKLPSDPDFSSVLMTIKVIDCNKDILITDKSELLDPDNCKAGNITINPSNDIEINNGEIQNLTAHNSIIINPGVSILEGSNFTGIIEKCPEISCPCTRSNSITNIKKETDSNERTDKDNLPVFKSEIQVYPNPTNNLLYIDLSGNLSDVLYYEVYNSLGKLLYKKVPVNEIEEYNFQGNAAGLYLFRATYLNGDIELKRIVYTK